MLLYLTLVGLFVASVTGENVLDLVDSDFDSKLAEIDTALVMFYAPWCGHCKRLKPEFEKAGGDLLANDPPVSLVKVDCTEGGKDTCGKFEVKGYPTLKIFRNGELSADYNGPREAAGIIKFMKSQVGPASKKIESVAAADAMFAKDEVVVFGLGAADSDIMKTFDRVSGKMREDVTFAHSSDAAVLEKLGHSEAVVLFRPKNLKSKFEDASLVYDGAATDKTALEAWIKKNYHGLCGLRTTDNAKDFVNPIVVAYFGVDYAKNPKGTNYWRNRVMKIAKAHPDNNYAISNKDDFQHELSEYGFDYVKGDTPVVAAKDASGQKFKMEAAFSMDTFGEFLTALKAGELEPWMKSEPVPEIQGDVKVAVAKNFDELVTNNKKDVLVEFYAPWCGHCKKLTPIFEELGEAMRDEDVEIVKMDATANDVPPSFSVSGFPTLFWIPSSTKKSENYNGGRELPDFIKFLSEKATNELKGYTRKGKAKKEEL
jgi:protein disulfide isomerase family A protein 3